MSLLSTWRLRLGPQTEAQRALQVHGHGGGVGAALGRGAVQAPVAHDAVELSELEGLPFCCLCLESA